MFRKVHVSRNWDYTLPLISISFSFYGTRKVSICSSSCFVSLIEQSMFKSFHTLSIKQNKEVNSATVCLSWSNSKFSNFHIPLEIKRLAFWIDTVICCPFLITEISSLSELAGFWTRNLLISIPPSSSMIALDNNQIENRKNNFLSWWV